MGAVDGVQHPDEFGVGARVGEFLADDAVVRVRGFDQFTHGRLGLLVGDGDGGLVRFRVNRQGLSEMGHNHATRRLGQLFGQADESAGLCHGSGVAWGHGNGFG